jgi:PAS domain S-box-containing protein
LCLSDLVVEFCIDDANVVEQYHNAVREPRGGDELTGTRRQTAQTNDRSEIQERAAHAARLFEGDDTLRTLLESLAEGVVVVDHTGLVLLVNRRIEEMFGYRRDEVVGCPLSILLPERFVEAHTKHIADYFARPRMRPMGQGLELIGRRKDGTNLSLDISLSFLNTEAGPLGLAFVTDVTLRKQAETALKQRNEELDAYAQTVAHDLNTPLALLIGYSETLVEIHETLSPQERHNLLKMIARNARRMSNIISELLLFASIPKEDVEVKPLDMAEIVEDVLGRLNYTIEEYQAEILQPDRYPQALGYAGWVSEVWQNYISNGLKYGGRPPRLELGGDIQGEGYVKFWVKDNGAGLTAEQQSRLFAPWTQLGHSPSKGHGLGLSIARRIVEKLNGQVDVESEVGKGSIFSFTLPAPE